MAKKAKPKKVKKTVKKKEEKPSRFALPVKMKLWIWGVFMFLAAFLIVLSFFNEAGVAGRTFMKGATFLVGKTTFSLPLLFILGGLIFFNLRYRSKFPAVLAIFLLILGISGIFACLTYDVKQGGWIGYFITWPFLEIFGLLATVVIFAAVIVVGILIIFQLLYKPRKPSFAPGGVTEGKPSIIKRIFAPKFKVKEISPEPVPPPPPLEIKPPLLPPVDLETKPIAKLDLAKYQLPPLDLLERDRGVPSSGDIRINSTIIKRTLQNFDISVEMSEVNIGPTVTQYTLKPAEGVKLTKITTLSNDLALALASHPIRIEAPIPGRPLVGIEVPNRVRTQVRLRNLIEHPDFQRRMNPLTFCLGRDVSGLPVFATLDRMPHLLVAGSTGTGKTICLNSIILSLLYQNGPQVLKFILIDPKRVEFSVYNGLPHLLTPVIYDAQKTVNVLKWLIGEMERRFDVFSKARARDIASYNGIIPDEPMPYIILIIDELADLMAARGREVEAGIVRLAQMARAVGIHLVVATQRPSVEVITGLIKANITSRVTFQVASQVDSRTVLDTAGAEKLLGLGDMLFVSAEISKPRRIQGAFVSDKEVKKAVNWIKSHQGSDFEILEAKPLETGEISLEKTLEEGMADTFFSSEEDPLYEEAKKVVIESRKASASLLQRRLRVGYARAARLVDMLEERGVVGPGEGAKPREILIPTREGDEEGWEKV